MHHESDVGLPIDNDGALMDPANTIPKTFVPVPIGGNVNVKLAKNGQTRIEDGPRIEMLASFLPGGFKNWWDFNLGMGTGNQSQTKLPTGL